MTANQSNQIVKNPNTKKAIAVLERFAKLEAEYKALEKESDAAIALIRQAMIEQGIVKIDIDTPTVTGYITLAERVSYKAEDLETIDEKFLKLALDTSKVKAEVVLSGKLPEGIEETKIQYVTKKLVVNE